MIFDLADGSAQGPEKPIIAVLRGSDSRILGGVSLIAERSAAIALSQGGAKKRYSHTDPNEDAAAFALGERGSLLAVADGHNGSGASETAIDQLMQRATAFLSRGGERSDAWWQKIVMETLGAIQRALLSRVEQGVRGSCRTTLALALVLPAEDWLGFASLGDSHIFRIAPNEVVDLGAQPDAARCFLGNPADDLEALAASSTIGVEALADTQAIALATDGISERGIGVDVPEFTLSECAAAAQRFAQELRPLELARNVAEAALAAHRRQRAGDNIAAAVSYLPLREPPATAGG